MARASAIAASSTSSTVPRDAATSARAFFHDAGAPILIAVAVV
jgi:hypothetical protein